nr:uncharacterized protein si:ch211-57i17.5 [Nothobranchius furzeri]XP_054604227.1 uncharacterized protein si:ch211-57i17.5 [Nothobranchius furzeri]
MTAIALLLLAVMLAVMLHRALNKPPLTRERPPLVALPMQKRSPMAVYPPSNSVLVSFISWSLCSDWQEKSRNSCNQEYFSPRV